MHMISFFVADCNRTEGNWLSRQPQDNGLEMVFEVPDHVTAENFFEWLDDSFPCFAYNGEYYQQVPDMGDCDIIYEELLDWDNERESHGID